eukprot:CAMPEP_0173212456 /NCGR_PEP_ID=MMETSP1141-20130122/24805_1 /TAXON_ID=483371 /ORGANISM="non described non described, Strain CCMP2298" /LENGTH=54 /DNA_ID=CAMNT_0014139467 /DNA_START=62 /DNA_END=226 /DNA_ORIENTATION=+
MVPSLPIVDLNIWVVDPKDAPIPSSMLFWLFTSELMSWLRPLSSSTWSPSSAQR